MGHQIPFGHRLRETLEAKGAEATQAWLAKRSGVDRSLISRIIKNDRVPTLDTLQALAPALEVDLDQLVKGTDAEDRLTGGTHVRRSDYEEAIRELIAFESKSRDLQVQCKTLREELQIAQKARRTAEARRSALEVERDDAKKQARDAERRSKAIAKELERYKAALQRAMTEFSALQARVAEVQAELAKTRKSSGASAILAGVAAAAGVATLASFLGSDDKDDFEDDEDDWE